MWGLPLAIVVITRLLFWDFRHEVPFMLDVLNLTVKRFTVARRGRDSLPSAEGRMQQGRQRSFKAAAIAWCLTADFYFAILYALKDESTTLLQWLCAPHVLGGAVCWVVLRTCSRPAFHATEAFLERFLVLLLVVCVLSSQTMPKEMLPCLSCCRMMVSIMFLNPFQAVKINLLLSPIQIALQLGSWSQMSQTSPPSPFAWTSFLLNCTNEGHILVFIAISSCYLDASLREKVMATMKMEAKTGEAEANLAAARKLLKVTCDSSLQLTEKLEIMAPERAFLEMLGSESSEVEGRSFLDFISPSDRQRFVDVVQTSSIYESPAGSLSVHLVTPENPESSCEVRLYHVKIHTEKPSSLDSDGSELPVQHLLGATQITTQTKESPRAQGSQDMRFLLGECPPGPKTKSGVSESALTDLVTVTTSQTGLSGLEDIKLTIDAMSLHEGFLIQSAEFNFDTRVAACYLPNLMEWVQPEAHQRLFCWIQDQVNAIAAGKKPQEPSLQDIRLRDPSGSLMAGTVTATELFLPRVEDGYDRQTSGSEGEAFLLRLQLRDWHRAS